MWEALQEEILGCHQCPLAQSRTQAVPGEGPQEAVLVIIGEAPGRQEDQQGRPFVGAAGQLLTQLLEGAGIKRSTVFITNIVKCRPPDNRQPTPNERKACYPYLLRQLNLIQPKIIALAGRVPAEFLLKTSVKMGTMHGKVIQREGQTYFVMYHPAAGLYTQSLVLVMEEDMRQLKSLLDRITGTTSSSQNGQLSLSKFFSDQ